MNRHLKVGTDKAAEKKAKLGVKMFIAYTLVYSGFVVIGLTKPELNGITINRWTESGNNLWIWINSSGNSYGIYL